MMTLCSPPFSYQARALARRAPMLHACCTTGNDTCCPPTTCAQALKIAETLHCSVLCMLQRELWNESMAIGRRAPVFSRDADNAETTRVFLASAYPEVPVSRYTIAPVSQWLELPQAELRAGSIWVTRTAMAALDGRVDPSRIRVLHPLLAEDFIDELRCLALFA